MNDPQNTSSAGGSTPVFPQTPPPPIASVTSPIQETVVIPPQSVPGIPPTPTSPTPKSRGGIGRIFFYLVLLLVFGGLAAGGFFVWRTVSGPKEVTITYWGLWESEQTMAPIISDFETKHPKIKIQYVKQSPQQYRARLQGAIDRGEGPDVFRFHNTWVPMLRNILSTVPKTIMTPTDFSSFFYPIAGSDLVSGQLIYGIPMMIDGLGLYYNQEVFGQKGIVPPTTWEELLALIPTLTEKTEAGITRSAVALGTTGNVEHFSDIVALMLSQNGATLSEPVGKEAEETLIFYRKFADPSDELYTWNETFDNSIYAFATGRVMMIFAPSWRAFDIKQINPSLQFAVSPMPQLPGTSVSWASYWVEGVSSKSKYPSEAWEFVSYLTSQDTTSKLYTEAGTNRLFGEPYARVALGSSLAEDPIVGAYIKQAPTAVSFPLASRTLDEGINDKLIKYLTDAMNGLSSGSAPSAVLETAAAGFRQVLGSYGLTSATALPK